MKGCQQKVLKVIHGEITLPTFLPDGTNGIVRSLDFTDLNNIGVQGIVMNAYHLMRNPGTDVIKTLGGLHKFINWDRVILTDSGGFQIFSLIRENPKFGTIREEKIIFRPSSEKKITLTPEKCIQAQFNYGTDIMMSLDYCTHPDDPYEVNKTSVESTIRWAKNSKKEYENLVRIKYKDTERRPLIFGIIQGGNDKNLRRQCAEALLEIGFNGYGFGGWPFDKKGNLVANILKYTAELMPDDLPKYAMGIGKPENIVICAKMGYNLFDCVVPTREARHGKLYVFNTEDISLLDIEKEDFYENIFIRDKKYIRDNSTISDTCNCYCCRNFSRAYLHHLFDIEDCLASRLATIHNLYFYIELMNLIRERYFNGYL